MPTDPQAKELLKLAEAHIVKLQEEKEEMNQLMENMMVQQQVEADEMVRLTEQIWKLEDMLKDVTNERDDVRLLLQGLRSDMERIRDVAAETLKSTKDKQSLVDMAVKFYDVKTLADSVKFIKD